MFCTKCGNILPDNAKFCTSCGAKVEGATKVNAECDHPHDTVRTEYVYQGTVEDSSNPYTSPKLNFTDALRLFFDRIMDFHGRSRRSEYWWVILFFGIVQAILESIFHDSASTFRLIINLVVLPLTVRRLHDVGKRGTFYLWNFLPLIGQIIVILQLAQDSVMADNEFGPCPKLR